MLSQNPIFRVEEHLSHNLTDALWLSADAYYNVGGETSIDGTGQDNMANTLRVGAGLGLRIGAVQTWLTWFSTMSAWSPSLLESQMRKRYASPSGSRGESWRSQFAARLSAPIARQLRGRQRAENVRIASITKKGEDNETENSGTADDSQGRRSCDRYVGERRIRFNGGGRRAGICRYKPVVSSRSNFNCISAFS